MLELDHIAITVNNLEESINFYQKLGYVLQEQFNDEEYKWATLKLGNTDLELFEPYEKKDIGLNHIAYSFENDDKVIEIVKKMGYNAEELDVFYGHLNRKSFFIKDKDGLSLQFIKK